MRKLPSKSDFNNQILPRPVRCFLSGLICCTLFRSRKFCGTFFILVLDFYLQDSNKKSTCELQVLRLFCMILFLAEGIYPSTVFYPKVTVQ